MILGLWENLNMNRIHLQYILKFKKDPKDLTAS